MSPFAVQQSTSISQANAKLMVMRARLLHAATVAYEKDPSTHRLEEMKRVVEMTRSIIHDEVSEQQGEFWAKKLRVTA